MIWPVIRPKSCLSDAKWVTLSCRGVSCMAFMGPRCNHLSKSGDLVSLPTDSIQLLSPLSCLSFLFSMPFYELVLSGASLPFLSV